MLIDGISIGGSSYSCTGTYRISTSPHEYRASNAPEKATSGPFDNASTAKCKYGKLAYDGGASAFNLNASKYIPRLKSAWLTWDSISASLTRNVDDQGGGPGPRDPARRDVTECGWLDVYIPYINQDNQQRIDDFGDKSWQDILEEDIATTTGLTVHQSD